jgi:hypothetical protein
MRYTSEHMYGNPKLEWQSPGERERVRERDRERERHRDRARRVGSGIGILRGSNVASHLIRRTANYDGSGRRRRRRSARRAAPTTRRGSSGERRHRGIRTDSRIIGDSRQ